jgi:hypothetical protein
MIERRKEIRKTIPEIYQTQMTLKIRTGSGPFTIARLLNVSLRGIKIGNSFELVPGSMIECSLSMRKSPEEEIPFYAIILYCLEDKVSGTFGIGAEIIQTSERLWVKAFFKIHDFIDKNLRMQDEANLLPAQSPRI